MLVRLYGVASDISRRLKLPVSPYLTIFPSLPQWLLSLRYRSCEGIVSVGTGLHNSVFWLDIVFCNSLCVEREVSLMRTTTICGYKCKILKLCWFYSLYLVSSFLADFWRLFIQEPFFQSCHMPRHMPSAYWFLHCCVQRVFPLCLLCLD